MSDEKDAIKEVEESDSLRKYREDKKRLKRLNDNLKLLTKYSLRMFGKHYVKLSNKQLEELHEYLDEGAKRDLSARDFYTYLDGLFRNKKGEVANDG